MQADFRTLLLGAGSGAAVIAWNIRPQGSPLPAVVLTMVSEEVRYTYSGEVLLVRSRVQMDTYAASTSASVDVDSKLADEVSGYRGVVGGTGFGGIFLETRFDEPVEQTAGGPIYRISRDLMVNWKET